LKIQDKAGLIIIISIDEGSYKFFEDLFGISCEFTINEENYVNCSNKTPKEIRPKDQGGRENSEYYFKQFKQWSEFGSIII
jgi:hypothetical protein